MKGEKQTTVRQDWVEFSGSAQQDVNQTLADLQLEIEIANARLAQLHNEDPEQAAELAYEMIEFLDSKWGYFRDYFMVTGKWYTPTELAIGDEGFMMHHEKSDAFNIAKSNGFTVYPIESEDEDDYVPEIGLSFIVGSQPISTPKFQGRFEMLAFAKPSEISLQFMRPNTSDSVGASIEEVSAAIENADALLRVHLNDTRSTFFESTATKQGAFLQSVIDYATDALPPVDSLDRVTMHDTEPTLVYVRDSKQGKIYSLGLQSGAPIVIEHGVVLDFTTIDTLKDGIGKKRYTSPAEMNAYKYGLCAVVSPTRCNIDLSDYNNPDIIVPLRSIKGTPNMYLESIPAS